MTEEEKQRRKSRSVGRPKQEDLSKKRDKKLTLSSTQDEYDYLLINAKGLKQTYTNIHYSLFYGTWSSSC
jgi:hypothetical protein